MRVRRPVWGAGDAGPPDRRRGRGHVRGGTPGLFAALFPARSIVTVGCWRVDPRERAARGPPPPPFAHLLCLLSPLSPFRLVSAASAPRFALAVLG